MVRASTPIVAVSMSLALFAVSSWTLPGILATGHPLVVIDPSRAPLSTKKPFLMLLRIGQRREIPEVEVLVTFF